MRRQINYIELDSLYKKIGQSIWHLQYVEDALIILVMIKGILKDIGSHSESESNQEKKKLNKCTLGQLIYKVEKLNIVDIDLLNKLKDFNNSRKWIVHNAWRESGEDLYTDQGRNRFFKNCELFINNAISLHKEIQDELVIYSIQKGISKDKIFSIAETKIKKLKGEI